MTLHWKPGLQALKGSHRSKVLDKSPKQSCDIDTLFESPEPNAPRWDYIVERKRSTRTGAGIEVHPADVGQVDAMIAKKHWAVKKITTEDPELRVDRWHWIATGGVNLPANSPKARKLAAAGISYPCKVLHHV